MTISGPEGCSVSWNFHKYLRSELSICHVNWRVSVLEHYHTISSPFGAWSSYVRFKKSCLIHDLLRGSRRGHRVSERHPSTAGHVHRAKAFHSEDPVIQLCTALTHILFSQLAFQARLFLCASKSKRITQDTRTQRPALCSVTSSTVCMFVWTLWGTQ